MTWRISPGRRRCKGSGRRACWSTSSTFSCATLTITPRGPLASTYTSEGPEIRSSGQVMVESYGATTTVNPVARPWRFSVKRPLARRSKRRRALLHSGMSERGKGRSAPSLEITALKRLRVIGAAIADEFDTPGTNGGGGTMKGLTRYPRMPLSAQRHRSTSCRWITATAATVVVCGSLVLGQTDFTRVTTQPDIGRADYVLAVADLDGDRRDDLVIGGKSEYYAGSTPQDRFVKTGLYVFVSSGDGTFRHAPEIVDGRIEARNPIVVAGDFNRDGRTDLAVFDAGVYVNGGYGNPPALWLSQPDGRLRVSQALADAVRREHARRPSASYKDSADLHLKSVSAADVDRNGTLDIWVESTGGANMNSHLMMDNGDGTFEADTVRVPHELVHNRQPEFWRHQSSTFVDIDNDGDLDLALGQMRDLDPTHINQWSLVLINDGTGRYRQRIELPHPDFNGGHTQVFDLTHADVNADGFQDLVLAHQRNDDGPPGVLPFTGRYLQILVNRNGSGFVDETSTRLGNQDATTLERRADGTRLANVAAPLMRDVDRDGCLDIVMARSLGPIREESPLVYRNNGSGRFQAMAPEIFAGTDRYLGTYAVPVDANVDGVVDFVVPYRENGPDGRFGTGDDFTNLVALLNTTPAGPQRCAR